jgi:GT2 family glycosyltransferase
MEMNDRKKVFVIVVAYKGHQWYKSCFDSLIESSIHLDIVVIDNASNDGTVEWIQSSYPEIHVIKNERNLGFGQANNLGIRYALDHGCDYVFLLNQDAWVEYDTLEKLLAIHQSHNDYGIISPIHLNREKTSIEHGVINYLDDKKITDSSLFDDMYFQRLKDIYSTTYINAASWLIPRSTLEVIGGFDPIFYHYGEDDNYLQRVAFHGVLVGVCPQCIVVHDTERRIPKSANPALTADKDLLVELTDINKNIRLSRRVFFHLRKSFTKAMMWKWKKAKYHCHCFGFIINNRKAILTSRSENMKKQPSWL